MCHSLRKAVGLERIYLSLPVVSSSLGQTPAGCHEDSRIHCLGKTTQGGTVCATAAPRGGRDKPVSASGLYYRSQKERKGGFKYVTNQNVFQGSARFAISGILKE